MINDELCVEFKNSYQISFTQFTTDDSKTIPAESGDNKSCGATQRYNSGPVKAHSNESRLSA